MGLKIITNFISFYFTYSNTYQFSVCVCGVDLCCPLNTRNYIYCIQNLCRSKVFLFYYFHLILSSILTRYWNFKRSYGIHPTYIISIMNFGLVKSNSIPKNNDSRWMHVWQWPIPNGHFTNEKSFILYTAIKSETDIIESINFDWCSN